MYVPKPFQSPGDAAALALVEDQPFAILAVVLDGAVEATHVPVLFDRKQGPMGTLRFHLARANPIVDVLDGVAQALFIFPGAHHYISPDWYDSEAQVPTWNYASAHVYGRPAALDAPSLRQLLVDLSAASEAPLPKTPWRLDKVPREKLEAMERAIAGYAMPVERIIGKHKLNQNRTAADRAGVIGALRAIGGEAACDVATMMEALDRDPD